MQFFSLHGGHSIFSHGQGTPEEFVQAALKKNFSAFGFSEHLPRPKKYQYPNEKGGPIRGLKTFPEFCKTIDELKKKYAGQIKIFKAVEIDYFPDQEKYIRDFVQQYDFDYCVGSVHFLDGIPIDYDRTNFLKLVAKYETIEKVFSAYYQTIQQMIKLPEISIVAHLDLIKMWGFEYDRKQVWSEVKRTLKKIKEKDLFLEINTAGLDKPCQEIYPADFILQEAERLEIPLTLADDSHGPEQVGRHYDEVNFQCEIFNGENLN